jgi:hypothetical protein
MSTADTKVAYEASDPRSRPLVLFAAGLAALIGIVLCVAAWIVHAGERSAMPERPGASPPSGPSLQAEPRVDLRSWLAARREQLEGYGWVDREAGIARIPIERAMQILLERGFPVAPASREEDR